MPMIEGMILYFRRAPNLFDRSDIDFMRHFKRPALLQKKVG